MGSVAYNPPEGKDYKWYISGIFPANWRIKNATKPYQAHLLQEPASQPLTHWDFYTTYIPLIVLAFWGIKCHQAHLLGEAASQPLNLCISIFHEARTELVGIRGLTWPTTRLGSCATGPMGWGDSFLSPWKKSDVFLFGGSFFLGVGGFPWFLFEFLLLKTQRGGGVEEAVKFFQGVSGQQNLWLDLGVTYFISWGSCMLSHWGNLWEVDG